MQTMASFLGFIQPNGTATATFEAAFGAEQLIADGIMKESQVKGQTAERRCNAEFYCRLRC
jgi:hypothetical protein